MERSRRSNLLFCYGFLSRFRFLNDTIMNTLVIIALSDDLWRLPARGAFAKNLLREESNKHHEAVFEGVHR